jgi:hypothetical protein
MKSQKIHKEKLWINPKLPRKAKIINLKTRKGKKLKKKILKQKLI